MACGGGGGGVAAAASVAVAAFRCCRLICVSVRMCLLLSKGCCRTNIVLPSCVLLVHDARPWKSHDLVAAIVIVLEAGG